MSSFHRSQATEALRAAEPLGNVPVELQAAWAVDDYSAAKRRTHMARVAASEVASAPAGGRVFSRRSPGGVLFLTPREQVSAHLVAEIATAEAEAEAAQKRAKELLARSEPGSGAHGDAKTAAR